MHVFLIEGEDSWHRIQDTSGIAGEGIGGKTIVTWVIRKM